MTKSAKINWGAIGPWAGTGIVPDPKLRASKPIKNIN